MVLLTGSYKAVLQVFLVLASVIPAKVLKLLSSPRAAQLSPTTVAKDARALSYKEEADQSFSKVRPA